MPRAKWHLSGTAPEPQRNLSGTSACSFAARRLARLAELVHCGGVDAALVVSGDHVEIVEGDPVACTLDAVDGLFEQQQADQLARGNGERHGERHTVRGPRVGRAALGKSAVEL